MKLIHTLLITALLALSSNAFGLGLQMYSLQEDFDRDTPGTLDRLKSQGFTDLETSVFTKLPAAELRALLEARCMTCSSHHVRPEDLEKKMGKVIADAKALGAVQVVCPILPHKKPLTREQVLKAAANFNRYGAALKAAGLRFAYHNHGTDFLATDTPSTPGETFYDVLIAATEPGVVSFQLDVFWVAWGGIEATDVIEKYGRRICSLHLKDLAKDAKPELADPKSARQFMVRLAAGRVDVPAVIAAAKAKGVTHFIIEDESPSAADQIPESLKAVKPLVATTPPTRDSLAPVPGAERRPFIRAEGAGLTRAGAPFRAVGFNQPDLFSSVLLHEAEGRAKSFAAIEDASRSHVRFLRFWASGFWPRDMKLYFSDKPAYWARMDEVFRHAREKDVMLVPSLFWMSYLWSDLCDEPRGKIADPNSKTYQAMRTYATELVSRYKDDPNVLMWELGNEYFLSADLDAARIPKAHGAGAKHLGTRPARTREDSLTTDQLVAFYANMTAHLHAIDPNHLVTSGDSRPRPHSRSLRENFPKGVWKEDSIADHMASLRQGQSRPLDVICIHYYGNMDGSFPPDEKPSRVGGLSDQGLELLTEYARTATAAGMPFFVGELGQHAPFITEDPEARFARAAIDLLEKEGADLIAIWVWHYAPHPKYTVSGSTYPALLKRVSEFNRRHAYGDRLQQAEGGSPVR